MINKLGKFIYRKIFDTAGAFKTAKKASDELMLSWIFYFLLEIEKY